MFRLTNNKPEEKKEKLLKLVITDRYCINDHKTNLNGDLNIFIRKIDIDSARIIVKKSEIYTNHFKVKSDYMIHTFEYLIESSIGKYEEENFQIDEDTTFLIISLDKNGQPQFHLVGDDSPCQLSQE